MAKTSNNLLIGPDVVKTSNGGWTYKAVFKVSRRGSHRILVEIHVDGSHSFQSYMRAKVYSQAQDSWNPLTDITVESSSSQKLSSYDKTWSESTAIIAAEPDAIELLRRAAIILDAGE